MKPKINLFLQYLLLLAGILVPIFVIDQSIYQNAFKDRTIPPPPFMALHIFLSSGGYCLIGVFAIILYSAILLYKQRDSYNANGVLVSIWTSVGFTIITFLIGTLLIGALGLLLVSLLMPSCWESCPTAVIFFSPLLGGLIAVIAGTIRGRNKYQSIKKERLTNLPK